MDILEQTRAVKTIKDLEHVSHEGGLRDLGLFSLEMLGSSKDWQLLAGWAVLGDNMAGGACAINTNQEQGHQDLDVCSLQPRGLFFTYHSFHTIQKCKSLPF